MKLIRFGKYKEEKPGILDQNEIRRDCSNYFNDWDYDFF
ncbi:MAG: ureidoglycolate lyase, partial [bacterium]|nr:ureidoglycolate lyase [bacterium]